jgi:predicted RNA-binding protein YlqC (UPF0109 family)
VGDPVELVRYVAEGLVDDPSGVEITVGEDPKRKTVRLTLAPDDMGRLIGRDGRIANALRTLLKAGRFGDRWGLEVRDRE